MNQSDTESNLLLVGLSGLCWFGPAALQSVLPAVNISQWRTVVSDVPGLSSIYIMFPQSQSAEGAVEEWKEVQPYEELLYSRPPAEVLSPPPSAASGSGI